MKKILLLISLIVSVFCSSCRDELSSLGSNWLESDLKNVLTDTCTVKMSTVWMDSINTSNKAVAQIGHYSDNTWGKITGTSFIEYSPAKFSPNTNLKYQYDSLTISMKCNGEYLGDTLAPVKVRLHELTDNIELNSTTGYLYNTSSVPYNSTPLSTITIYPRPKGQNLLEYRLSDDLGQKWFNKILDESEDFSSSDKFRQYFRGISFVPDESADKSIMGFGVSDSSMYVTLYYHEISESSNASTLKFTPNTPRFNKVTTDRTGSPIEALNTKTTELVSDKTANITFVQGLTGLYTKLEFPYLNNLLEKGQVVSIESATLYLYPVKGSYGTSNPLPSTLALYKSDENNVTQDQIKNTLGTSVQSGNLVTDEELHENTYYSFDITSFLQSNLGQIGYNIKELQLVIPEDKINTSYRSVIFGDKNYSQKNKVKLSVLYKVYNPY